MLLFRLNSKYFKISKYIISFLCIISFTFSLNKYNIKVAIATMVKMENHYIKEWVEYYKRLGFKKIFIYDNNDINGEKLENVINKYITHHFVEIINYRGKSYHGISLQRLAFLDCYNNKVNDFDYIALFDADEFLYLGKFRKIYDYISQPKFSYFDCIKFPWLVFDDNDLIYVKKNDYSLIKRFTRGNYYSTTCKSIFKTGFTQINSTNLISPHGPVGLRTCDPEGIKCNNGTDKTLPFFAMHKKIKKTKEYIKHFKLKTLEEFIDLKLKRLYIDMAQDRAKKYLTFSLFFSYNKKTKEKLDFIKQKGFNLSDLK